MKSDKEIIVHLTHTLDIALDTLESISSNEVNVIEKNNNEGLRLLIILYKCEARNAINKIHGLAQQLEEKEK